MARTLNKLSDLAIRAATKPGRLSDGGGLYLQVTEGGASWVYRYMLAGRAREMGLGPLALYGLSEARTVAHDARRLRHQGVDPIEARRAARAARMRPERARAGRSARGVYRGQGQEKISVRVCTRALERLPALSWQEQLPALDVPLTAIVPRPRGKGRFEEETQQQQQQQQ